MRGVREELYELALFAGAGGGLLGSRLLGWKTICYVEHNLYRVEVLKARIRDGYLNDAPIWDDVRTFDGHPWAGLVDVVTAGFPCQPFAIGSKKLGDDDDRNMWPDTIRIIGEVKPPFVFLENSTELLLVQKEKKPYITRILGELASVGYVGWWGCLSAASVGADHKRKRLWIVANASEPGRKIILRHNVGNSATCHAQIAAKAITLDAVWNRLARLEKRLGEPSVFGIDDGMAHRVDRLAAIGDGQVPEVVRRAWTLLNEWRDECAA